MSPVTVTWRRTVGLFRNRYSTGFVVAGCLAAIGVFFTFGVFAAEGQRTPLATVWAAAVSPVLPVLAALLSTELWSDERLSGRVDLLLTAPVRERDFVIGKFLGLVTLMMAVTVLSLVLPFAVFRYFAPGVAAAAPVLPFLTALLALALQGVLWSALASAVSVVFRRSAATAAVSLVLFVMLPRVAWQALIRWSPNGAYRFGEMPLDAHVTDIAAGAVSTGTVVSYAVITVLALFFATKFVAALRFVGRGVAVLRASTAVTLVLGAVSAVLAVTLAIRLDVVLELPVEQSSTVFSGRTKDVLAELRGNVSVTLFSPRSDPRFRQVSRLLRAFKRAADSSAGVRISLRFVDPRWDIGSSERLVKSGATAPSVVFTSSRRQAVLPLADGYGERELVGALLRVALSYQRRNVYWTFGHGESSPEGYSAADMSDIARELARDGYSNLMLDLASVESIPADCALVVIAGAKDDFSRVEADRIETYLRQGGRLLVLVDDAGSGGVSTLLPAWGVRPVARPLATGRCLDGGELVLAEFSAHEAVAPLGGSQVVFDRPVAFEPSAAAGLVGGADRIGFEPLVSAGGRVFAVATERGAGVGDDTAIRPTRLIAVGDSLFVTNGRLAAMANANRDFFLNCVAYLAGSRAITSGGVDAGIFAPGLGRGRRLELLVAAGAGVPFALLVFMAFVAARRRRRE